MYIDSVEISNIKSIKKLFFNFDAKPGWNVLLGDNGSGKSTVLKSIAICLVGDRKSYSFQQDFSKWITYSKDKGKVVTNLLLEKPFDSLVKNKKEFKFAIEFKKDGNLKWVFGKNGNLKITELEISKGWFSLGLGPHRSLGEKNSDNFLKGKIGAHITLFRDDIALSSVIDWLKDLKLDSTENKKKQNIYNKVIQLFNETNLLPENVRIKNINSKGIQFNDHNGNIVDINNLSDGYKSILGLASEIMRQLFLQYQLDDTNIDKIFNLPGVILIDEIDVHLHPKWQSKIGFWLKKHFPKIQFIVSTHSPIICQAAEGSAIWKMEHPSAGLKSRKLPDHDFNRLVYGNVLEALETSGFGVESISRAENAGKKKDRLSELNVKSMKSKLTAKEEKEFNDLLVIFPTFKKRKK